MGEGITFRSVLVLVLVLALPTTGIIGYLVNRARKRVPRGPIDLAS